MALAQFRQAQTNVRSAQLDLSYTKIFAPCDGRVTRKAVEPGDYVQTGQQLMSIVPNDVWVVANFKESQLKHMRPGQPCASQWTRSAARFAGTWTAFRPAPARVQPVAAGKRDRQLRQGGPARAGENCFRRAVAGGSHHRPRPFGDARVRVSRFEVADWAVGLLALVLAGGARFVFRFVLRRKMNRAAPQ